jgi:hypothetical protein
MNAISYPSGPDLSAYFPKLEPTEHPLPAEFDDNCSKCKKPMTRMPVCCWTRQRPYATFQCKKCKKRLFLFKTTTTPLLVWSDELPESLPGAPFFSETIDDLLAERERNRERRAKREQEAGADS